ncbi:unnamed protein product, partial [Meganyctiphanes norvegica]
RVSEKWRVQGSLSLSLGAMLLITAMTYVDTDDWQYGFYTLTMVLIGLLNASIAILQASSLGIAGMFPTSCVKGMVSGQALAGVFLLATEHFSWRKVVSITCVGAADNTLQHVCQENYNTVDYR